jgi:hypothetical protein
MRREPRTIGPVNAAVRRHRSARTTEDPAYPAGTIGSDLVERAYVSYLVERYHRCRQMEPDFYSGPVPFSYAAIFMAIERKFKAPTYFVPRGRFEELVEFLQRRIDGTMLGKDNRAREIRKLSQPR